MLNNLKRGPLDYVLAFIAAGAGLASTSIALRNEAVGAVLIGILIMGMLFSLSVSKIFPKNPKIPTDGLMMALASAAAVGAIDSLNLFLPNGGYPQELITSSILSWMVVLGSFFCWRDGTLLFVTVPSIAMFGLVGAYDTFPGAPAVFFVFLICLAVLFGRTHLRSAADWAEENGHDPARLQRYEWSALAGPEWALGSALLVIVSSILGAPVIQRSVSNVTRNVQVDNRALQAIRNQVQNNRSTTPGQNVPVGRGPIGTPSDQEVLRINVRTPILLRNRHYAAFENGRWQAMAGPSAVMGITRSGYFDVRPIAGYSNEFRPGKPMNFRMRYTVPSGQTLSLPAETALVTMPARAVFGGLDGTISVPASLTPSDLIIGVALMPDLPDDGARSIPQPFIPPEIQREYNRFGSTERVRLFAQQVVEGATTDYEKALRIQRAVSRTITYNLQAPAIVPDLDPADTVLFETKEGYCDLFATSVAEMARAAGLYARVATGYLLDPESKDDGLYVVRERHAHMWAEIYFEGHGWIPFDATEGANEVAGAGRGSSARDTRPFWARIDLSNLLHVGLTLLAVAALAAGGWLLFKVVKNRASLKEIPALLIGRDPSEDATIKLIRRLEKMSDIPRRFEQTPREYVTLVGGQFTVSQDVISQLAQHMETALYSTSKPAVGDINALGKTMLADIKRSKSR